MANPTVEQRFWQKVDRTSGCWLWTGYRNPKGYGQFGVGHRHLALAHRVSWELTHGPIPTSLHVLHICDTPPCVRPDHLVLGTIAANQADMVRKGRSTRGTRTPGALLTPEAVTAIRRRYSARTVTYALLGREFGVDWTTIRNVVKRRTWTWVERED